MGTFAAAPDGPAVRRIGRTARLNARLERLFSTEPSLRVSLTGAFLLSALVLAFKAPDSLTNPQFWAEDGPVFFAQQRGRAWPLLFEPYASYLHFAPRLVAWIGSFVPVAHAPALYCYAAWILGAGALSSLRWLPLGPLPFIVLLSGVALTPTNGEVFGTATNMHWLFQFHLLASIARFVTGARGKRPWLQALVTLCVGLSGPFAAFAFAACLALWLLTRVRVAGLSPERVHPSLELAALGVAGIAQLLCSAFSQSSANLSAQPVTWLGGMRTLSLLQLHAVASEPLPRWLFRILLVASALATLALLKERNARSTLLGIYLFSAVQLAAVIRKFAGDDSWALATMENADRYFVMPKAVIFWQVAILVASAASSRPRLRPYLLLAVMFGLPCLYSSWLQRPTFPDMHWQERAERVRAGESLDVQIQPPGWQVHIEAERAQPSTD